MTEKRTPKARKKPRREPQNPNRREPQKPSHRKHGKAASGAERPNQEVGRGSTAKSSYKAGGFKASGKPSPKSAPQPAARPAPKPAPKTPPSPTAARGKSSDGALWLYGRHAVAAALANPARNVRRAIATKNAGDWLQQAGAAPGVLARLEEARPEDLDTLLQAGAVHQGIAALVEELPKAHLKDVCDPAEDGRPVLILDQITDPQNIGALFRSAAAFGARAVIVQDRRTPPLSGALAKAAAGAIEILPCVEVVNIARAINELQELGYFCAGLAGDAEHDITALPSIPLALVMGAEGAGLRQLVAKSCDGLYRIPIAPGVESLNVSNAAAISLYEARRPR